MKKIKLTVDDLNAMVEKFRADLFKTKVLPKTFTYNTDVEKSVVAKGAERPMVIFSETADKKMRALVDVCTKEIGWYGICRREMNVFHIDDIVIPPQTVTGSTVTTGDWEFQVWMQGLTDDQVNGMRYYGHSHVNMGTTPSATDNTFQNNMMQNINDFYIFSIENKRSEEWWILYDIENNILYDKADIDVVHHIPDMVDWASAMIDVLVDEHKTTYSTYSQGGFKWGNGKWSDYDDHKDSKTYEEAWIKLAQMKKDLMDKDPEYAKDFLTNIPWEAMKGCLKEEEITLPAVTETKQNEQYDEEDESYCRSFPVDDDDEEEELVVNYDWLTDPMERAQGTYVDDDGVERYIANNLPLDADQMDDEEYLYFMASYYNDLVSVGKIIDIVEVK